jgi:hypothetical protein
VDSHRLLVDRRLERVVVVGKRGEFVGHAVLLRMASSLEDMLRAAPVKPPAVKSTDVQSTEENRGETWRLLITTRRSPRAS